MKSQEGALLLTEWNKLISVVNNIEDEVLFRLTVSKGFRREDIGHGCVKRKRNNQSVLITTGIKIENILFEDKILVYYDSKKNMNRIVPLNTNEIRLIKKLIKLRGANQHEYLITSSGRSAHRKLQEYCDKAGIRRRSFHSLRSTCMQFCISAGWTPDQISKLTGDTISVIQEYYVTPPLSNMAEVAESKPII